MLRPFIVTSWHGTGPEAMDADVRAIFTSSDLPLDPNRLNLFAFVLDPAGRTVHAFHGLPGRGAGRSDYRAEIERALGRLGPVPADTPADAGRKAALPDLPAGPPGTLAGVRLFIGLQDPRDPFRSRATVIEVVPMMPEQWRQFILGDDEPRREIPAESLREWLVHLYPPGIRTADQSKPFRQVAGTLTLEAAGRDGDLRYSFLSGEFRLAKGEGESAFEGRLEAVVASQVERPEIRFLRGTIEGTYLYRIRGEVAMKMKAAIESRPEHSR